MKKTWHRLILDFIMLVGIASLYSENAVSMSYHEIGGLVLFGLFLVHLIFNRKWIKSVFVKLFSRGILLRTRILCVVDILLLVCWAMVIVSGACISKVVFSFRVYGQWKMLHFFFAALSLVLSGIHLGFHVKYFAVHFKKNLPLPGILKKILVAVLAIAIVIVGAVNYNSSGLDRWLSMPFGSAMGGGPSGEMRGGASGEASGEIEVENPVSDSAAEETASTEPAEETASTEPAEETASAEPAEETASAEPVEETASEEPAEETASEEPAEETASEETAEAPASGEMRGGPSGEMHGMGFHPGRLLSLVWKFGTVVLAVMTVTGAVDTLCAWAKRHIRSNRKK